VIPVEGETVHEYVYGAVPPLNATENEGDVVTGRVNEVGPLVEADIGVYALHC